MAIYCPVCATAATDDVKFCKKCGANLRGVAEALQSRNPDARFDWSRTWVADMLLTDDERARRRAAADIPGRPQDLVAAELKQVADLQNEIKGGIITMFVGVGLAIFLFVFLGAIASVQTDPKAALILSRIWIAGVIPFFVGLGILANAFFVSRRFSEHRQNLLRSVLAPNPAIFAEPARTTGELPALEAPPSVTEQTTRHLPDHEPALRTSAIPPAAKSTK